MLPTSVATSTASGITASTAGLPSMLPLARRTTAASSRRTATDHGPLTSSPLNHALANYYNLYFQMLIIIIFY